MWSLTMHIDDLIKKVNEILSSEDQSEFHKIFLRLCHQIAYGDDTKETKAKYHFMCNKSRELNEKNIIW